MDFVRQLDRILQQPIYESQALEGWNVELETLLFAIPEHKEGESKASDDGVATSADEAKSEINNVVLKLQGCIVVTLAKVLGIDEYDGPDLEQLTKRVFDDISDNSDIIISITNPSDWAWLEILVRTSGNILRWYLQVFLQKCPLVYPMSSAPFQSLSMLSILLFLIEHNGKIIEEDESVNNQKLPPSQRFARYASLLLFYATFSPRSPNDEDMQKAHERLVDQSFIPRALKMLIYPPQTSAALALSLIRNVHNLLASFPAAIEVVQQTGFPFDANTAKAPWSPKKDDNTDNLITYPSVFRDILIWSLNAPNLPAFPGSTEDKRSELVVEILGIIFAMGGTEVARALRYPCPNEALSQLVITSLQTPDSSDSRLFKVKLSTINILTDASPSFGTFLVEKEVVPSLFEIAERQIDTVMEHTHVDTTAIAALVPSLTVLYKFSAGNSTFRDAAKDWIFPPSQDNHFWRLAQQQLSNDAAAADSGGSSTTNNGDRNTARVPAAKNMHPLDAPRGSLRWKLIRLMTWTESYIKRYSSELLWALCDEDPKEFVLRTGLGNAMGFLGAKGMIQLP
jgi:Guanine nucleotide exchange factor synembryn